MNSSRAIYKPTSIAWVFFICYALLATSCGATQQTHYPAPESVDTPIERLAESSMSLRGYINTICAEDVEPYSKFIYVADGPGGVAVLDASDISRPALVNRLASTYAFRVYIHEAHLYLCDAPAGIKVYSLADPRSPALTFSADTRWASGMAFANGHMYLADYYDGLRIYDIADPASPVETVHRNIGRLRDIGINGNTLVTSDNVFGMMTFNLSSPTDTLWTYNAVEFANFEGLVNHKGYSIIARNDEFTDLDVFWTADAFNIKHIDQFHPVRFISDITGSGDALLIAAGEDGVLIFDMTDPAGMTLMQVIQTPNYARRAKGLGKYLYVADMAGVCIYGLDEMEGMFDAD